MPDTATNADEQFFIVNKDKLREILGLSELEKKLEERNKDKIQYLTFAQKLVELENKKVCCEQDNGCSRLISIIERIDKLEAKDGEIPSEQSITRIKGKKYIEGISFVGNKRTDFIIEKEPTEAGSARQTEFELIEKFIPPRGITCNDCMNMGKDELKVEKADLEEIDNLTKRMEIKTYPKLLKIRIALIKILMKYLGKEENATENKI